MADCEKVRGKTDYEIDNKFKGNVIYVFFVVLGLGTLLPWNFFITAESYWQFKFRNVSDSEWMDHGKTELQRLYTPMLTCLSQITNFTFLFINALFSHMLSKKCRLLSSLSLMILFFSLTTALVQVDTDGWQIAFFGITMFIVFSLNASAAIFQGGLFGIAGMFPERYMCAVSSGQALGGVFASASRIVSQAAGADNIISAFIFFAIAVVVMAITLAICVAMMKMPYYHHYATNPQEEREAVALCQDEMSTPLKTVNESESPSVIAEQKRIFSAIWPLAMSVWGVFMVTLAVFPVICVRVISTSSNPTWKNVYFQSVITFLLFNVGDYVGRYSAGLFTWPRRGSRLLYIFVALRLVFIPLFMLCNHDPLSDIPSIFTHDAWYILFMSFFSLSNGYLATLCMMYGPRMVAETDSEKAGSMMAAMIGLGLLSGALLSFAFALIS